MADINTVVIVGRLTKAPELRKTSTGKSVVSFTVACNRDQNNADFINATAWDKTAELIAQYFTKGSRIGITGRWATRKYESKEGKTVTANEVAVREIMFLDPKGSQEPANDYQEEQAHYYSGISNEFRQATVVDDDMLPF